MNEAEFYKEAQKRNAKYALIGYDGTIPCQCKYCGMCNDNHDECDLPKQCGCSYCGACLNLLTIDNGYGAEATDNYVEGEDDICKSCFSREQCEEEACEKCHKDDLIGGV
jgi:hypothetical protein